MSEDTKMNENATVEKQLRRRPQLVPQVAPKGGRRVLRYASPKLRGKMRC